MALIEQDEILEGYFRRYVARRGERLVPDRIGKRIPGRFRLNLVRARAKMQWMQPAVRYLLDGNPERRAEPVPLARCGSARVSPDVAEHLETLLQLFRWTTRGERYHARCGAFLVPKKSGRGRYVFDARRGNGLLARVPGFVLFSLADLLKLATEMLTSGHPSWAVAIDFRHYFYQIPIRGDLAAFMALRIGQRSLVPKVLLMGHHNAPVCAQTLSWIVVLHRERGEESLGVGDVDGESMPPYVRLVVDGRCAGFLLVLLDNVLVWTTDEKLREAWRRRLHRNVKLFGVRVNRKETQVVNFQDPERSNTGAALDGSSDDDASADEMPDPPPTNTLVFSGVEFCAAGWRSASGGAENSGVWATQESITRQEAASVCGTLLWDVRVRGECLGPWPATRGLYGRLSPPPGESWRSSIRLSPEELAELVQLAARRAERSWTPARAPSEPEMILRAATDATPSTIAWVYLSPVDWAPRVNWRRAVEADVVANADKNAAPVGDTHSETDDYDVAYTELLAVVVLVEEVAAGGRVASSLRRIRIELALDSLVAVRVLQRTYSRSPRLDALAGRVRALREGVEVVPVWVPSAANVADTATRRPDGQVCERCGGWRKALDASDPACRCDRPYFRSPTAEEVSALVPARLARTLLLLGASA
jgi:hypothetical protein